MDNTIIAALVGAGGTVTASIVAAIVAIRKTKDKLREEQQALSQTIGAMFLQRYGFKTASSYSQAEILDLEGNSRVTRRWQGVKVSEGVTLSRIPQRAQLTTPGAKIVKGPILTGHNDFPKELSIDIVRKTDQESNYQLEITGSLTPSDPPLDYEIQLEYSKAVLMSLEDVERLYHNDLFKRDYHAVDVDFPMDTLELSVVFPQNFPVALYAGVFYGHSEVSHEQEYHRVQGGFKIQNRGASFKITDPLIGFRYFIYWTPPSRKS